jgi:hypothetical protein
MLAWDKTRHGKVDIRLFYAFKDENGSPSIREPDAWTNCRWAPDDESLPLIYRKSNLLHN